MKQIESVKEWGGWLNRYSHDSTTCQCEMTFSVYLPKQALTAPVPVLYWLSGLTCTDDNVRTKAGAQRYAAEHGIALVMPDTSPRGKQVADEPERYDLGKGAGFYVNATEEPWKKHYQMYEYVTEELPELIEGTLPLQKGKRAIAGHSMGGHGALVIALRNPDRYRSASAFAPICNPVNCDWGKNCFTHYLGQNADQWAQYDASELLKNKATAACPALMIDQGSDDEFLAEQLNPQAFLDACKLKGITVDFRECEGYDHSYHFISTFIGDHFAFHAKHLA